MSIYEMNFKLLHIVSEIFLLCFSIDLGLDIDSDIGLDHNSLIFSFSFRRMFQKQHKQYADQKIIS